MASSRSLSSPEAELRHWLQDVLIDTSIEETGRELRRTPFYSLNEVSLGGLSAVAVTANEKALQLKGEHDPEYAVITEKVAEECHRYARLRHPNVLQFLGVSFPKSSLLPILVIEQIDFTLSQCLHRFSNLPDYLKVSILLDTALGLQCFHDQSPSIPHGSLTASSVFLTSNLTAKLGYPPVYKVFGGQGPSDESPFETNGLHMSSAFTGIANSSGFKDDIFAFGELMVHVITQRRPKRVQIGYSPSLIQQIENVDGRHMLRGLIMQCLQKDPVLRPTASEIVQEIKMCMTSRKSPFQDPIKLVSTMINAPHSADGSPNTGGSPTEVRVKRLETENARLVAQLKVTQSELRHLRVQQTLFGNSNVGDNDNEDDDESEEKVEMKDVAVQVDILQANHRKVYIELHKESSDQSLGFSIAGGKGAPSTLTEGDQSVFITRLAPGGLAEKDGRLKPGDRLVSVNGINMDNVTRAEALTALMSGGDICAMVISREEVSSEADISLSRRRSTSTFTRRKPSKSSKLSPLKLGVTIACDECTPLPEPVSNAQAISYKNKIIIGGHYSNNSGSLFEYDPETDKWTMLATSPVWFYGLTVFQDKITLVGGFDPTTQDCSANLFSLNEREGTWMGSLPPMPTARMHSAVVSLGSSLVVAGGRNNKASLNCVEVFSFASQQWYIAHPLLLEQSSIKSICHSGYWYLLGGEQQGFGSTRAIYTPLQSLIDSALHKTGSVSCFKAIRTLPTTYAAVTIIGGKIIAIGGNRGNGSEISSSVYALCEDPFSWLEVGELPIPLTHTCAIPISDEEVLVIGGRDENGKDSDVVYHLYLQEKSYTQ